MKHVQESLSQFKEHKFFNSLFEEEEMSPAELKQKKETIKHQAAAVIQKCKANFEMFKKHAGDIWQEYRDFDKAQEDANQAVQQKGMFYNLFKSDYIVGIVKEPNGKAALKVFNTSAKDKDEYVAFSTKNPEAVKEFKEFLVTDYKSTMETVKQNQVEAMAAKKAADEARQKEESAAKKQAKLDAFIGE